MNTQNPNQQGEGTVQPTPAQISNMLTKAIREEMAAQRKIAEKSIEILMKNGADHLRAVSSEESSRLSKQFEDAQKKLRLADTRETGLAIRESELKGLEESLAHRERELESRAKVHQQRADELARAERAQRERIEELEKKAEQAEKFIALRLLKEKQILEAEHRRLQIQADWKAAQELAKDEEKLLDFEITANDAAMAAAMSSYAPDLEEKLQALADEYKNEENSLDEPPKPRSKRRAPAKKDVAVSLKDQLPAKEAPEALPEI